MCWGGFVAHDDESSCNIRAGSRRSGVSSPAVTDVPQPAVIDFIQAQRALRERLLAEEVTSVSAV